MTNKNRTGRRSLIGAFLLTSLCAGQVVWNVAHAIPFLNYSYDLGSNGHGTISVIPTPADGATVNAGDLSAFTWDLTSRGLGVYTLGDLDSFSAGPWDHDLGLAGVPFGFRLDSGAMASNGSVCTVCGVDFRPHRSTATVTVLNPDGTSNGKQTFGDVAGEFVLTSIPEPSLISLVALGLGLVALSNTRSKQMRNLGHPPN